MHISRARAFLTHLSLSALTTGVLLILFVFFYFPLPYFLVEGGWQGIRLILAVDVILGPTLTLIIFNPKKSRGKLIFDLVTIGLLQISALTYGFWTVYTTRTVAVIYADGSFYPIEADTGETLGGDFQKLVKEAKTRPFYGVIDMPDDLEERQELRWKSLGQSMPMFRHVELLKPMTKETLPELKLSARPYAKLPKDEESKRKLEEWMAQNNAKPEDYIFAPAICRFGTVLIILREDDLTMAGYITGFAAKN